MRPRLALRSAQPASGRLFAFPGFRPPRGFTLLEVMAVLVIMGIVMTFVALSTGGDRRGEQMEREARRLIALLELAGEEAVMRSEQLALRVGENDYEFMILDNNEWVAIDNERPLRPHTLAEGIEMRLELEDNPPPGLSAENSEQPQVFMLSSGEMTPFIITFFAEQSEQRYSVKGSLLGRLEFE